jgi:hypothetical protein
MKDIKPLLLILLSAGLVGTWVYHLYDKTVYSSHIREVFVKDSAAVADAIKDSLQKFYSFTIRNLDAELDSTRSNTDFLRDNLGKKVGEINVLRKEISDILKNRNATQSDLSLARRKINDMQSLMEELRTQNSSMEEEKKRLASVLDQLSGEMKGLEQNIRRLDQENKDLAEKVFLASSFLVTEIQFHIVALKGSREQPATQAKKAEKFVLSFTLINNIADYENTEVVVIITDPSDKVIQNTIWNSGTFGTRNEGTKSYTMKVKFEYLKGEPKKLTFSVDADKYEKGTYRLQLYHNGIQIGKAAYSLK